jgi:hypothetical protein
MKVKGIATIAKISVVAVADCTVATRLYQPTVKNGIHYRPYGLGIT